MTPTLENSLTVVRPGRSDQIGYETFADPDSHLVIRDRTVADAFHRVAMAEGELRRVRVGGPAENAEVEFWVLDLNGDEHLRQRVQEEYGRVLRDALHRISAEASAASDLIEGPRPSFDVLENLIEIRRFLANSVALGRRKGTRNELLFHHVTD